VLGRPRIGAVGRIAAVLRGVDDSEVEEKIYILMGSDVEKQEEGCIFLCGNCAAPTFYNRLRGTFIPGCPPSIEPLLDHLRKMGARVRP